MSLALTIVSILVALSSGAFVSLYWWSTRKAAVSWWQSNTGRNLMALPACLVLLGAGTATRWLPWGGYSILAAGVLVSLVLVWRTVIMWRYTHPRNLPPPTPAMPQPTERGWYSPTPTSVIEPPRRPPRKKE